MKISVQQFGATLEEAFSKNRAVVFLCGPTLKDLLNPGAKLRQDLKNLLESEGFEVVLGEDDGLELLRDKFDGYAHENELQFIQGHCNAVILIAASVGAFCELGLFAFEKARGVDNKTDFVLIIDKNYEGVSSYLNEGPAAAIDDCGMLIYADFENFDHTKLLKRLKRRRHLFVTTKYGGV